MTVARDNKTKMSVIIQDKEWSICKHKSKKAYESH